MHNTHPTHTPAHTHSAHDALDLSPRDVVRARRFGNRSIGTYVIDSIDATPTTIEHAVAVYAHREHGPGKPTSMLLDTRTIRVVRNYR